ncbi:acyl CoA binding protein-domain-containing protein [Circinella umbellata]|nr:acyl CoA binding protein-domain-containing protein [Circinella umbellata]
MSTIPPHYSDHYVGQRFNKALHIVQHLSPSSSFQPTKEQKLELYALYKQAAQGNVDTQRPGIFDVVGRAKWDAWKKLEGLNILEAKHRYVEVLLRVAVEAYRKPAAKVQAHQIIQAFATMQPSGDHTDDDDSITTDDDDETSVASVDAEEQAYLLEIQQQDKNGRRTATPSRSSSIGMYRSPMSPTLSRTSAQSTARYNNNNNNNKPMMNRTTNNSRTQQHMRAPSAASSIGGAGRRYSQASVSNTNHYPTTTNNNNNNNKRRNNNTNNSNNSNSNNNNNNKKQNNNRLGGGMFVEQATEPFDPHVNPWAQQPSTVRQYKVDDGHSETSSNFNDSHRPSIVQLPSPIISATSSNAVLSPAPHPQQRPPSRSQQQQQQQFQQQQLQQARHMHSPSSVASSMTAMGPSPTPQVEGGMASSSSVISQNNNSGLLTDHQYTSVVALGPATKRALDTLQAEIIALNDRIDGLRQELVERDRRKVIIPRPDNENNDNGLEDNTESWDGWRWVIKAAIKYATVNLLLGVFLFLALYRQRSPIAYVILGQLAKYWRRTKLRFTFSKILV